MLVLYRRYADFVSVMEALTTSRTYGLYHGPDRCARMSGGHDQELKDLNDLPDFCPADVWAESSRAHACADSKAGF